VFFLAPLSQGKMPKLMDKKKTIQPEKINIEDEYQEDYLSDHNESSIIYSYDNGDDGRESIGSKFNRNGKTISSTKFDPLFRNSDLKDHQEIMDRRSHRESL
jgi:hypothetical protein